LALSLGAWDLSLFFFGGGFGDGDPWLSICWFGSEPNLALSVASNGQNNWFSPLYCRWGKTTRHRPLHAIARGGSGAPTPGRSRTHPGPRGSWWRAVRCVQLLCRPSRCSEPHLLLYNRIYSQQHPPWANVRAPLGNTPFWGGSAGLLAPRPAAPWAPRPATALFSSTPPVVVLRVDCSSTSWLATRSLAPSTAGSPDGLASPPTLRAAGTGAQHRTKYVLTPAADGHFKDAQKKAKKKRKR
jgi:hypothetical protein